MFSGLLSAGARRKAPRNRQALLTSSGIFGNRCTQLSETRRNSELLSAEQPSATGLNQANKRQASNPSPSPAAASPPFALEVDIRCEVFPYRLTEFSSQIKILRGIELAFLVHTASSFIPTAAYGTEAASNRPRKESRSRCFNSWALYKMF